MRTASLTHRAQSGFCKQLDERLAAGTSLTRYLSTRLRENAFCPAKCSLTGTAPAGTCLHSHRPKLLSLGSVRSEEQFEFIALLPVQETGRTGENGHIQSIFFSSCVSSEVSLFLSLLKRHWIEIIMQMIATARIHES